VTSEVKPFPLEKLTEEDVARARNLRHFLHANVRIDALTEAVTELLEALPTVRIRRLDPLKNPRQSDDSIGVLLAPSGDTSRRFLVSVEGALGALTVARALRQRIPRIMKPASPPPPSLCGSFAAVLLSALRKATVDAPFAVLDARSGKALAAELAAPDVKGTSVWVTVLVGDDAFDACLSIPDAAVPQLASARFDTSTLLAMGEARLAVPLVLHSTMAHLPELKRLATSDVFLPSGLFCIEGAFVGPVALVPPRGEKGIQAELTADGHLVVRGRIEPHEWGSMMSNEQPAFEASVAEVLEDVSVVVRIEVGVVEMTAREWATLAPGDILRCGRRIGDMATLRVGGVELARGQLVHIDGELGVRIVQRTTGEKGERK
jgi:flagellar motor switch/type III secretory pathway protein FliN